jgi:hypothetical protein
MVRRRVSAISNHERQAEGPYTDGYRFRSTHPKRYLLMSDDRGLLEG